MPPNFIRRRLLAAWRMALLRGPLSYAGEPGFRSRPGDPGGKAIANLAHGLLLSPRRLRGSRKSKFHLPLARGGLDEFRENPGSRRQFNVVRPGNTDIHRWHFACNRDSLDAQALKRP